MKADYLKFVPWSKEDGVFVGYCPDLFIGGTCHGADEQKVYRELVRLVAQEIAERTPALPKKRAQVTVPCSCLNLLLRGQCRLGLGGGFLGAAGDFLGRRQRHEDLGGDVAGGGKFDEAFLALGERFVGVAFFGKAALRFFAAQAKHRVDVAAEQGADVDFHLFLGEVGVADHVAIDGAGLVFRKHDRGLGQTREQAGQLVLQLSLFCTWMCLSPSTP